MAIECLSSLANKQSASLTTFLSDPQGENEMLFRQSIIHDSGFTMLSDYTPYIQSTPHVYRGRKRLY